MRLSGESGKSRESGESNDSKNSTLPIPPTPPTLPKNKRAEGSQTPLPTLDTVIVAAGQSRRMAQDKMTLRIAGRTVLEWSFAACAAVPSVRRIVVVCAAGREEEFRALLTPADTSKKLHAIVPGGELRSDSVAAGLAELGLDNADFVAVHDAARPFVRPEAFEKCFVQAIRFGAAALAERVVDTLHRTGRKEKSQRVVETVSRDDLWRVQTPQIARHNWLFELYELYEFRCLATDEIGGLVKNGFPAVMVENPFPNPKITTPADLPLAEAVANTIMQ